MRARPWAVVAAVAALVFALDFATKRYVEAHMRLGEVVPVVPGVFDIAYIRNSGAAFSILQGRTLFLVAVTLVVLAFVVVWGDQLLRAGRAAQVGVALVVGGAAGNLWDRLTTGGVADFLHIHHWPVFNLADSAVVVGGALVAWALSREGGGGARGAEAEAGDGEAAGGRAGGRAGTRPPEAGRVPKPEDRPGAEVAAGEPAAARGARAASSSAHATSVHAGPAHGPGDGAPAAEAAVKGR